MEILGIKREFKKKILDSVEEHPQVLRNRLAWSIQSQQGKRQRLLPTDFVRETIYTYYIYTYT